MARPTKYTPQTAKIVLDGIRAGLSRTAAAGRADVHVSQIDRWAQRFASFATDLMRAEAEAEARFTSTIAQASAPHDVVETRRTVETVIKTRKTRHPDGTVVEEPVSVQQVSETTSTRREFDWRAAESWLKRRRREDWSERQELTGKDGGPIGHEHSGTIKHDVDLSGMGAEEIQRIYREAVQTPPKV